MRNNGQLLPRPALINPRKLPCRSLAGRLTRSQLLSLFLQFIQNDRRIILLRGIISGNME